MNNPQSILSLPSDLFYEIAQYVTTGEAVSWFKCNKRLSGMLSPSRPVNWMKPNTKTEYYQMLADYASLKFIKRNLKLEKK